MDNNRRQKILEKFAQAIVAGKPQFSKEPPMAHFGRKALNFGKGFGRHIMAQAAKKQDPVNRH